jgi:tetratricopeptide (TPR) repeat protein
VTSDYEQAVRLDPNHDKARLALAELYIKAHRLDDAAREYAALLARRPEDPEACLGLGQIAAEKGQEDEATRYFDRALKAAPQDNRPLIERGKMDVRRGRLESALTYFDKAIQLDASEPDVHYQRSLLLARLGRSDEAKAEQETTARLRGEKEELDKLLKRLLSAPNDVELQYQAARWLFDHGHPDEGLRWAEKIVRERPQHAETNQLLADYHERRGNKGLANYYRMQASPR